MNDHEFGVINPQGDVVFFEIINEPVRSFFLKEIAVFSEKFPEFDLDFSEKAKKAADKNKNLKFAHVFSLICLAGRKKRKDIFSFIQNLQKRHSCFYLVCR